MGATAVASADEGSAESLVMSRSLEIGVFILYNRVEIMNYCVRSAYFLSTSQQAWSTVTVLRNRVAKSRPETSERG